MVSLAILIHPQSQPLSLHSVPSHCAIGDAGRRRAPRRYDILDISRWSSRSNFRAGARCTFTILQTPLTLLRLLPPMHEPYPTRLLPVSKASRFYVQPRWQQLIYQS
jgi:hypothetical protein